jgi:acyl carrier protein
MAEAPLAALEAEGLQTISAVLRGELGLARDPLPDEELVRDLQLDSVGLLTLVVALEDRFRVALREEDAAQVGTVRELAALVALRVQQARGGAGVEP